MKKLLIYISTAICAFGIYLFPLAAHAAITFDKAVTGLSSSGANVTSSAISTTGDSLLVAYVSFYNNITPTFTDNLNNTWNLIATTTNEGTNYQRMYYAWNPTVGSSQTFNESCGSTCYPSFSVVAFQGVLTSSNPLDATSSVTGGTFSPGSITPSQNNEVLVDGEGIGNAGNSGATVNSGFTTSTLFNYLSGSYFGQGTAYLIQTTAAAENPTWTLPGGGAAGNTIASFKAAPAAPSSTPLFGRFTILTWGDW